MQSPFSKEELPLDPDACETLQKDLMILPELAVQNPVQNIAEGAQTSPAALGALRADLASMQSAILEVLADQKKDAGTTAEAIVTLQGELAHMRAAMLSPDEHKRDQDRFATLQSSLASMRSEVLEALENSHNSRKPIMPREGNSWWSPKSLKSLANLQSEVLETNVQSDLQSAIFEALDDLKKDASKTIGAITSLQGELANMRMSVLALDDEGSFFEDALKSSASFSMLQSNLTNMCSEALEKVEREMCEQTALFQNSLSPNARTVEDGLQNSPTAAILQSDLASMRSEIFEALESQKREQVVLFENLRNVSKITALEDNSSMQSASSSPSRSNSSSSLSSSSPLSSSAAQVAAVELEEAQRELTEESAETEAELDEDLPMHWMPTMHSKVLSATSRQQGELDAITQTMQKRPEAILALKRKFRDTSSEILEPLEEQRSLQSSNGEEIQHSPKILASLQNDLIAVHSQVLEAIEGQKRVQDQLVWNVEPALAAVGTLEVNHMRTKSAVLESFEDEKKLLLTISRAMDGQKEAVLLLERLASEVAVVHCHTQRCTKRRKSDLSHVPSPQRPEFPDLEQHLPAANIDQEESGLQVEHTIEAI